MKKALAKLKRIMWGPRRWDGDTRRLPSLAVALKALVPRSVMREVMTSSPDRRQWGLLAAAWVGVSEREFMNAVARELRMSYQDHVVPPDLTIFGSKAREIFKTLRKVGASVVLEGDQVAAFVVTDPAEIRGVAWFDGTQPVSIAPWTEIAKALDVSERMIAEAQANADRYEAVKTRERCEQVIAILIREAVSHGSSALDILSDGDRARYQFATIDNKMAVGAIHSGVIASLLKYLRSQEGGVFTDNSVGGVVIRSIGGESNLRLSWNRASRGPLSSSTDPGSREVSPDAVSASDGDSSIAQSRRDPSPPENIPVLVVDDNPMFRRVLERMLKRELFEVGFASDGDEALAKLRASSEILPRVIICDLHMPKMNGGEFVRALKASPRFATIPVVMLTSDDAVDTELNALELGVDALVSKAKDPRVLCAHVSRLSRRATTQEAA